MLTLGLTCKYRHALPPGFVLKSQRKKEEADAKKVEITLEEFLDVEVSNNVAQHAAVQANHASIL